MATIILDYDPRSIEARKTLDYIISMGFFKVRKETSDSDRGGDNPENESVSQSLTPETAAAVAEAKNFKTLERFDSIENLLRDCLN
jgi:hypothetical protein